MPPLQDDAIGAALAQHGLASPALASRLRQLFAAQAAVYEAKMKDSEQRLRLASRIFQSTQESIVLTDSDGNIIAVNGAFEQVTGYSEQEVLGRNPRLLMSDLHNQAFYSEVFNSMREA
ncbi:PAS domain S-box protein [Massilia sp. H-1]|nr:PAS domain S-box protein [Massilia sp. H-1]